MPTARTYPEQARSLRATTSLAMILLLICTWCVMHRYQGFAHDAQVYALQALAKIDRNLETDLFFQYTSQDQFTIFPTIYAAFIGAVGLAHAAATLTIMATLGLYAGAWSVARALYGRDIAWIAIAMAIVTIGAYGAFNVFHYSEDFLSARLPAEGLVLTALACHLRERRNLALSIAIAALFVHPLVALPGVLLLLGLRMPLRLTMAAAAVGCIGVLALALLASHDTNVGRLLKVMDAQWSYLVTERSEFLYPQYWPLTDWLVNLRGLVCLGVIAAIERDVRVRQLCLVAAVVAIAGLSIAYTASTIGPIGLLMQGQAWRWEWVATFLSTLLLIPTAVSVARDAHCGPLCALLLLLVWILTPLAGITCALLALGLWRWRHRMAPASAPLLRWGAYAIGLAAAFWATASVWSRALAPPATGAQNTLLPWGRAVGGLPMLLLLAVIAAVYGLKRSRTCVPALTVSVFLSAAAIVLLPVAFGAVQSFTHAANESFEEWRSLIAPTATTFVLRAADTGSFVWLTLRRVNYLSMDQSAGMIFSRETALEVQRRSDVVLPVKDPDWKVRSFNQAYKNQLATGGKVLPPRIRPLTPAKLAQLCKDPVLGFVIAREFLGFRALRHQQPGAWQGWNLYDCHAVNLASPAA